MTVFNSSSLDWGSSASYLADGTIHSFPVLILLSWRYLTASALCAEPGSAALQPKQAALASPAQSRLTSSSRQNPQPLSLTTDIDASPVSQAETSFECTNQLALYIVPPGRTTSPTPTCLMDALQIASYGLLGKAVACLFSE